MPGAPSDLDSGRGPGVSAGLTGKQFAAELGAGISADDRALIEADWDLTRRQALLDPPEDTLSTLTALRNRGVRLGLLSNTHALEVRSWNRSPLASMFDVTAFSHEIGVCKPDPAAHLHVLGRLGVPARSAAYVGDGGSDELAGAREAGFGLVVMAEQAPARSAPAELPRLRAQADAGVSVLSQVLDLISS